MPKNKILLFHPRTLHEKNYRNYHVPYSLLSIASNLDLTKFDVLIIDDNAAGKQNLPLGLEDALEKTDYVGISSMIGAQIKGAITFAEMVRTINPNIPIIIGGPLPTMLPEQAINNPLFDIAVQGQGEATFSTLVNLHTDRIPDDLEKIPGISWKKNGKTVHNHPNPYQDLNNFLPYQNGYHLLDLKNYIWPDEHIAERTISYHSSQGCPFSCGFCCEVSLWQKWWSGLSPSRMISDIKYLVRNFDVNGVKFYDSEFFINHRRALLFAQGLLDESIIIRWGASIHPNNFEKLSNNDLLLLSKSGLTRLLIGAESGVQQELDLIGKKISRDVMYNIARRCAQYGIYVCFTYVTGYPSMPSSYIEETLDFAHKLFNFEPCHEHKVHFFGPYPGAPLYNLAVEYGFSPPKSLHEWSDYDYYYIQTPWIEQRYQDLVREFNETHYPYIRPYAKKS